MGAINCTISILATLDKTFTKLRSTESLGYIFFSTVNNLILFLSAPYSLVTNKNLENEKTQIHY